MAKDIRYYVLVYRTEYFKGDNGRIDSTDQKTMVGGSHTDDTVDCCMHETR